MLTILFTFISLINPTIENRDYSGFVNSFYACLKEQESLTVLEAKEFFGPYSLSFEYELQIRGCMTTGDTASCESNLEDLEIYPEKFSSMIYAEFRSRLKHLVDEDIDIVSIRILDEGYKTGITAEVDLSNDEKIYLKLNKYEDEPIYITTSFLTNGESVFNHVYNKKRYLKLLGIINDPDGYTNIRSGRSATASVVSRITESQLFYYTPSTMSNWWKVTNIEDCSSGYMHKSRIQSITSLDLSDEVSVKVKEVIKSSRDICAQSQ
ncbi:MAG: hypothetical protein RIC80_21770 [Cyclobacteriaceae bacterium]